MELPLENMFGHNSSVVSKLVILISWGLTPAKGLTQAEQRRRSKIKLCWRWVRAQQRVGNWKPVGPMLCCWFAMLGFQNNIFSLGFRFRFCLRQHFFLHKLTVDHISNMAHNRQRWCNNYKKWSCTTLSLRFSISHIRFASNAVNYVWLLHCDSKL